MHKRFLFRITCSRSLHQMGYELPAAPNLKLTFQPELKSFGFTTAEAFASLRFTLGRKSVEKKRAF